jgi:hypothetical protein
MACSCVPADQPACFTPIPSSCWNPALIAVRYQRFPYAVALLMFVLLLLLCSPCRKCIEVACVDKDFSDGYGEKMHREGTCYDEKKTVIVKIVDQ